MIPSEHDEQVTLCQWLDVVGVTYYAVPNGSNKSKTAQQKFKAEGLKAGVPDIVCLFDGGISVYIEMKRCKGGTVSPEQKQWNERLKLLGFEAHICKGAAEAIAVIDKHLPASKRKLNQNQAKFDV